MKTSVLALLFVCCSLFATAQSAVIKDIYPGGGGSYPSNLTVIDSLLYFSANNGTTGQELWKSNGTAKGTVLIKDIQVGKIGSSPSQFTKCGSKVFFTATHQSTGQELWVTDGTAIGTKLVRDIYPGVASSSITKLTVINHIVYFIANDGKRGLELWRSDGSTYGTFLLKDFKVGLPDGGVQSMVNYQNKLVFSRTFFYEPNSCFATGSQMWQYAPTTKAFSVLFGLKGELMDDLTAHNGNLYYGAGNCDEYISIYRLNADKKGGTWIDNDPGYRLSWMQVIQGQLVVAGADEYYPWNIRVMDNLNPVPVQVSGKEPYYFGKGVQDITFAHDGMPYFAALDYESEIDDAYSVFIPVLDADISFTRTRIATFKGLIEHIKTLNDKIIFTAYTSANGCELRVLTPNAGAREGLLAGEDGTTIKVYPNPASSQVTVEGKAVADGLIRLHDVRGREYVREPVYLGEVINKCLDVSALSNGMYLVEVNGVTHKLLIAK